MKIIYFFSVFLIAFSINAQQMPSFSSQGNPHAVCEGLAFNSDEEAYSKVKDICNAMDIAGNFMVAECGNVDNCKAVLNSSGSYIFYNKSYLQKIKGLNFTEASFKTSKTDDWDVVCILAHEIGHHILQHLANFQQLSRMMPLVDMELEADKFAGACMYRLGATLEQAQHVMYDPSVSEKASMNHPSRKERLEAIALGYNKVKAKYTNTPIVSNKQSESEKVSDAITTWSEGKHEKAVEVFEKFDENVKSLGYLGYAYAHGEGVPKDLDKAITYFTKAADQGSIMAQFNLGLMYYSGNGVPKNYALAYKYFSSAAAQKDRSSLYCLGSMYLNGQGVKLDYDLAVKYFKEAADQEDPLALYWLGVMYYHGINLEMNYTKAFEYLKRAAAVNNAYGQYWCGKLYESGEGVKRDMKQAINLYKLAALQNHTEAQDACKRLGIAWE